jgi:hypothetical protein
MTDPTPPTDGPRWAGDGTRAEVQSAEDPVDRYHRDWQHAMADAVTVLTTAARLRRPVYQADTDPDTGDAGWRADPYRRTQPADFAEFAAHALASAAANLGGIEPLLAGRPGSWEADHLRSLLTSTVGPDEDYLWAHRTEPLVLHVPVDDILTDLGAWDAYQDADRALDRAKHALNLPPAPAALSPKQEAALDQINDARDRLDQHRENAWHEYGQAYTQAILAELERQPIPGLTVPIEIQVTTDSDPAAVAWLDQALNHPHLARLHDTARWTTPLPAPELHRVAALIRDLTPPDGAVHQEGRMAGPAAERPGSGPTPDRPPPPTPPTNGFTR